MNDDIVLKELMDELKSMSLSIKETHSQLVKIIKESPRPEKKEPSKQLHGFFSEPIFYKDVSNDIKEIRIRNTL